MQIEFHAVIFDEDQARRNHKWGEVGFSFSGMSEAQRTLLMSILRRTADRLEEHREETAMSLRKTGSGQILGEDKPTEKTATRGNWGIEDSDELAAEMTEEERRAAEHAQ
jgi:hypothetical protein